MGQDAPRRDFGRLFGTVHQAGVGGRRSYLLKLMNTGDDLQHAFSEWRRLAQAEGKAIRAGDWPFVADCQKAITRLQQVIDQASNTVQKLPSSPVRDSEIGRKARQRATVLEL